MGFRENFFKLWSPKANIEKFMYNSVGLFLHTNCFSKDELMVCYFCPFTL